MELLIICVVLGLIFYAVKGVLFKIIIVLSVILFFLLNTSPSKRNDVQPTQSQGQKAYEEIKKITSEEDKKCVDYANNAREAMKLRQKGLHQEVIKDMFKMSNYKGPMEDVDMFLNDAFTYPIILPPEPDELGDYSGSDMAKYAIKLTTVEKRFYEKYYNKCMKK